MQRVHKGFSLKVTYQSYLYVFFSNIFYTTLVDCSSSPVASVDGNNERQKIHLAQNLSAGFLGTFVLEEEGNGFPPNRRSFKSLASFSRSHPLQFVVLKGAVLFL